VFRRISPKRYCRWEIRRLRRLQKEELRAKIEKVAVYARVSTKDGRQDREN
jgi:hypothetical protein